MKDQMPLLATLQMDHSCANVLMTQNLAKLAIKLALRKQKKTEVASDFSGCVCPGTNKGASFKTADCDVCSAKFYPKKDCSNKCDDSKA